MNIPILILWIIPGMLLFQWLDSLIDKTVFYWIWLYVLISLLLYGLPDLSDFFAPLQISIIKVPEFYLFVVFYVIIAPITLILWGWGITLIFTLFYAITSFYEIEKISKSETKRLSLSFNKYFSKKETTQPVVKRPIIIMTDPEKE